MIDKNKLTDIYLPVLKQAQRLGLGAPCIVKTWSDWWQEAHFPEGRLPEIWMSLKLLRPSTRRQVLEKYRGYGGETTAGLLFAHELGHIFRRKWIRNRRVAPLRGYREVFDRTSRFDDDPWNDMDEYLDQHPDTELDTGRYLNWYAWSNSEEDFCECFAELVLAKGDCSSYQNRPGVYRKLKFIRQAGRKILAANPLLRSSNRRDAGYLSAGETSFNCPGAGHFYGVPDSPNTYLCPCGAPVVHDGDWITHKD